MHNLENEQLTLFPPLALDAKVTSRGLSSQDAVLGDALENMATLEDNSFGLIVLDPDYQDWDALCRGGLIRQAVRLLKPNGNIVCFTKQPFDFKLRQDVDFMFRREIVWTFTNGGAWVSKNLPLVSFQKLYWCSPYKSPYFNPRTGEDYNSATKSFKRSSKVFGNYRVEGRQFEPSTEGIWLRDHIHENKPNCGDIPAKPMRLMQLLVKCLCPVGEGVLDPFAGSGVLAKICKEQNIPYLGIEINQDRYIKIQKMLSQTYNYTLREFPSITQLTLFS